MEQKKALGNFFEETGNKTRFEFYKNGLPHGHWITWHRYGAISSEMTYKDGLKEGKMIRYDRHGDPVYISIWKNNRLSGVTLDKSNEQSNDSNFLK